MSSIIAMTVTGIVLTLFAVLGVVRLAGGARVAFAVGMLCLAASWFLPAILSILLQTQQLDALPWPMNVVVNAVLYTAGACLILVAAVTSKERN